MYRDKVLEKYILKSIKEMILIFNTKEIELRKENYEILKSFYESIIINEKSNTLCEQISNKYSKEIKTIDYYFKNSESIYRQLSEKIQICKKNDLNLNGGFYLNNNPGFNIQELELLKKIINKTILFEIPDAPIKIDINKCPSIEKEAIICFHDKKTKSLIKS